jgi:hypothetical protein
VIAAVWRDVLAALIAGGATFFTKHAFPFLGTNSAPGAAFGRLVIVSAVFSALYLICVIWLHRSYAPLIQVAKLVREMTSRGAVTSATPDIKQLTPRVSVPV